ncbi:MAG: protein kinase [Planctomycetota bacterium]
MGSAIDLAFGRLAQARGWVDPNLLRQVYAQLPPGRSLAQELVARGAMDPERARQLWFEVQHGSGELAPVPGQQVVASPAPGAPVDATARFGPGAPVDTTVRFGAGGPPRQHDHGRLDEGAAEVTMRLDVGALVAGAPVGGPEVGGPEVGGEVTLRLDAGAVQEALAPEGTLRMPPPGVRLGQGSGPVSLAGPPPGLQGAPPGVRLGQGSGPVSLGAPAGPGAATSPTVMFSGGGQPGPGDPSAGTVRFGSGVATLPPGGIAPGMSAPSGFATSPPGGQPPGGQGPPSGFATLAPGGAPSASFAPAGAPTVLASSGSGSQLGTAAGWSGVASPGSGGGSTAADPRLGGEGRLPEAGELVDGRYRVERVLGKGGMGAVYKVRDEQHGVDLALKVMLAGADSGDAVLRFQREAEAVAKVDAHAGVVRIRGFGTHQGCPYAAMDLVVGRDLHERVKAEGPLPLEEALRLTQQVCEAIQHCHEQGVLHRDLKPANVLQRAADGQPFVTDFGLALDEERERLTKTGQVMGTPAYMPPEQAEGDKAGMDQRVDVYSLGAILYELLTGQAPFQGDQMQLLKKVFMDDPAPLRTLRPEAPRDLALVCEKAMAKDRELRYASAGELAADLAALRRGEPISARPPTRWERTKWRLRRKDPRAWSAIALLILLVCSGLGGGAWAVIRALDPRGNAARQVGVLLGEPLDEALAEQALIEAFGQGGEAKDTGLVPKLLGHLATLREEQAGPEGEPDHVALGRELARDPEAPDALQRPCAGLADEGALRHLRWLLCRAALRGGAPLPAASPDDPGEPLFAALRALHFGSSDAPADEELAAGRRGLEGLGEAYPAGLRELVGHLETTIERREREGWTKLVEGAEGEATPWAEEQLAQELSELLGPLHLAQRLDGALSALRRRAKERVAPGAIAKLSGWERAGLVFRRHVIGRLESPPRADLSAPELRARLQEVATRLTRECLAAAAKLPDVERLRVMGEFLEKAPELCLRVDWEQIDKVNQLLLVIAYQKDVAERRSLPAPHIVVCLLRLGLNPINSRINPEGPFKELSAFLEGHPEWRVGEAYFALAELSAAVHYAFTSRLRQEYKDKVKQAKRRGEDRPELRLQLDRERQRQRVNTLGPVAGAYLQALADAPPLEAARVGFGVEPPGLALAEPLRRAEWREGATMGLLLTLDDLWQDLRYLDDLHDRERTRYFTSRFRELVAQAGSYSDKHRQELYQHFGCHLIRWADELPDPPAAYLEARELIGRGLDLGIAGLERACVPNPRDAQTLNDLASGHDASKWENQVIGSAETWARTWSFEGLKPIPTSAQDAELVLKRMWAAEARVEAALKRSSPKFLGKLGQIALGLERLDDAERAAQRLLEGFGEARSGDELEHCITALSYQAMVRMSRKQDAEAVAVYEDALERAKRDPERRPLWELSAMWNPLVKPLDAMRKKLRKPPQKP